MQILPQHLIEIAGRQHAVLGRDDVAGAGVSRQTLRRWVARCLLIQSSAHTYRIPGAPESPRQWAMVAVLDAGAGAVLSHASVLALWEVHGFQLRPLHVLRSRHGPIRSDTVATVHSATDLPEHHVTVLDGIPVTTPTRACFDIAAHVGPQRLARTIDQLWSRRLTSGPMLHHMRQELSVQGRNGLCAMDAVLDVRGLYYTPPDSGQESRFITLLARSGQRPMEPQVHVFDGSADARGWIGRVDFIDRIALVIVEIDGDAFHAALSDQGADNERRLAYERNGYLVIALTQHELWHDPDTKIEQIRRARLSRRPDPARW